MMAWLEWTKVKATVHSTIFLLNTKILQVWVKWSKDKVTIYLARDQLIRNNMRELVIIIQFIILPITFSHILIINRKWTKA